MQIGQTYDIKISVEKMSLKPGEYKDRHKNVIRTSVQKVEFDRRGREAIEKAIHTIS